MYGGMGGGMGGGGMWRRLNATDEKPRITWHLLRRVLTYARPYRWKIALMFVIILVTSGLSLATPLLMRNLIDEAIPNRDLTRLVWLTVGLFLIPVAGSAITVWQRQLNASVGEGVVYDLRTALFAHFQAHVAALLHQHQNRRTDEPPE